MSDPSEQIHPDADLAEEDSVEEVMEDDGELDRLREENRLLQEKLIRVQADFQNSVRRLEKDGDQRLKVAAGHLVRDFLPVLDNLERAMTVPDTADVQTVVTGVRGTYDQWLEVLKANGVEPIAPEIGDEYDAQRHEALLQTPVDPTPEQQQVTQLLRKGFAFDGKLLRPAQVAVSQQS